MFKKKHTNYHWKKFNPVFFLTFAFFLFFNIEITKAQNIPILQPENSNKPLFTFYIPNAFTPNGDGINDEFFGKGESIVEYDMWIFDRWGAIIFHGKDLNEKWDGKANGENVQQDVYIWKVRFTDINNKKHDYIGTVTLVK